MARKAAASSLGIPRIPGYTAGMTPKTRYRQRRKLEAALTRVMLVLSRNLTEGIVSDKRTARVAADVVLLLNRFIEEAGVTLQERLAEGPDLDRFEKIIKDRRKETQARYRRVGRKGGRTGPSASRP
jgi:hypothetical protein